MGKMTTDDNDSGAGKYNLPDGEYQFRVLPHMETQTGKIFKTSDKTNDDNDDQIQLILKVGDADNQINIFETLTFSKKAKFRIRQFLLAVGAYPGHGVEVDLDAERCVGLGGKCTVKNVPKKNSNYEKTVVDEWIESSLQDSGKIDGLVVVDMPDSDGKPAAPDYSDDIPF